MKLTIKNLSFEDNNNFYTSIDDMEKVHKLDPYVKSTLSNEYELTITVDAFSIDNDGMLYIKKKFVGAEAILPIILKRNLIIEMEV